MIKIHKGFTLIELMIVVAIIGILAAVALPAYNTYYKNARFTEVVQMMGIAKTAVELCASDLTTLNGCSNGTQGVPSDITTGAGKYVASIVTANNGVITGTSNSALDPGANYTYIMTPSYSSSTGVSWSTSGTCIAARLCK